MEGSGRPRDQGPHASGLRTWRITTGTAHVRAGTWSQGVLRPRIALELGAALTLDFTKSRMSIAITRSAIKHY